MLPIVEPFHRQPIHL